MDVKTMLKGLLPLILFLGSACAKKKSVESVMQDDEGQQKLGQSCSNGQAALSLKNDFIIQWEDGSITRAQDTSREVLIKNVVEPQLQLIKRVENNKKLYLLPDAKIQQRSSGEVDNWGQEKVGATSVWSMGIDGEGVLVAVIDTGVDITHPQLKNQLAVNEKEIPNNQIDDDNNGFIDDYYGYDFFYDSAQIIPIGEHGTHVAGIVLADHLSGPMRGMAPGARLIPLNFMSESGGGNMYDAVSAIKYAVARGAKIINASWGGEACSEILFETVKSLEANGVIFVAAAGNEGLDLNRWPVYPAAYDLPLQITVGATAASDRMVGFSNYSKNYVHLMAPGQGIWSTVPMASVGDSIRFVAGYESFSGTSMAAPFVTGALALMMSARPDLSPHIIKNTLLKSVDRFGYLAKSEGRLNVFKAIHDLKSLPE